MQTTATYVWLWRAELELDEAYPSFFSSGRATSALDNRLVQHQTIYHFAVFDGASDFLDDADVAEINIVGRFRVNDFQDRVNGHRPQETGVLGDNLRGEGGRCSLQKGRTIG